MVAIFVCFVIEEPLESLLKPSPNAALSLFRFRLYRMALWWGDLYIAPSPVLGGLKIRFFFAFFLLLCYFTSIYA